MKPCFVLLVALLLLACTDLTSAAHVCVPVVANLTFCGGTVTWNIWDGVNQTTNDAIAKQAYLADRDLY